MFTFSPNLVERTYDSLVQSFSSNCACLFWSQETGWLLWRLETPAMKWTVRASPAFCSQSPLSMSHVIIFSSLLRFVLAVVTFSFGTWPSWYLTPPLPSTLQHDDTKYSPIIRTFYYYCTASIDTRFLNAVETEIS